MATKKSGSTKKPGRKPGAAKKGGGGGRLPPSPPPAIGGGDNGGVGVDTEGDPPIIVQGGGSIDVDLPPKFKEKVTGKKGGKFKDSDQDLISIRIDGGTEIPLNVDSRIEIKYGTRGTGRKKY